MLLGSCRSIYTEGAVSGPLVTDTLYGGLAGIYSSRDGYIFNTGTGNYGDNREGLAARAQLRWTPTERLDLTLSVLGYRYDDGMIGGTPFDQGDSLVMTRTFDGYDNQRTYTASLRGAYISRGFKIISITVHTAWREDLLQDGDFEVADVVRSKVNRDISEWSQEIRILSPDPGAVWWWQGGVFFRQGSAPRILQPAGAVVGH